jgi:hypothetical protein
VWPELYIDTTNVISQPIIDEFHETLSVLPVKADLRVTLLERRETLKKCSVRMNILLGCRTLTSAAYGMILRERRFYFRCLASIPVTVLIKNMPERFTAIA